MAELGVNIDHVATVRQARRGAEPDPVKLAVLAELGGADGITVHLREDQRHIQPRDVRLLRETVAVRLNLEMACVESVLDVAREVLPEQATLVPEKREEITTEGGLDVVGNLDEVRRTTETLQEIGVRVSLFLDPDKQQIDAAAKLGADAVEIHTGSYANAQGEARQEEWDKIAEASECIRELGMTLHAGHGLNYWNVLPIAEIPEMFELNIGHSIISRALFVGLESAVREMKELIR